MKTKLVFLAVLTASIIISDYCYSQNQNICGFVYDGSTKEPLIGATIYDSVSSRGVLTDNNGYFCFSRQRKSENLIISYIGYEVKRFRVDTSTNMILQFFLTPGLRMQEVNITGSPVSVDRLGMIEISIEQIKTIPTLTGEPDLLKSYQLMPGIQMGDEGSSGLYVRGGSPDQNLYLIDDIPLYYVHHLGGFISVFDVNSVKKATLYKSNFPARYGGRLSSVVDIRLKDGNSYDTRQELMIGTLASKYSIEGPLKTENTTFMFSARRCNLDLFMRPVSRLSSAGKRTNAYTFYDLNGKIVHTLNSKNKLTFLTYAGRDIILNKDQSEDGPFSLGEMNSKSAIRWGNVLSAFKWNHVLGPKWFLNVNTGFTRFFYDIRSNYSYESNIEQSHFNYRQSSLVEDISSNGVLNYYGTNIKINTGLSFINHNFKPSMLETVSQFNDHKEEISLIAKSNQAEVSAFIDNEWNLNRSVKLNFGIHSIYWPKESYFRYDPRLSLSVSLNDAVSLTGSYSVMHQFIHLLSLNSSGIPSDLWVPSTSVIRPARSEQFSAGIGYSMKDIKISAESFYKKLDNLIAYKEGKTIFNTPDWQEGIESGGTGVIKGIEFLIQKETGRHTGWIGYTLSRNIREFENLNSGNPFPYKYDRPHEVNVVYTCEITPNITFSANWIYASGNAITIATQKYPGINFDHYGANYFQTRFPEVHYYGGVNNYRTPAYHRMDAGFNFSKSKEKGKRNFYAGVYNIYNQKNPYHYYYRVKNGERKLFKFTMFPIIPSISYSYKF